MISKTPESSLPRYEWVLTDEASEASERTVRSLAKALKIGEFLARVLVSRGMTSADSARAYINPISEPLLPPEAIPGLEEATERLRRACFEKEQVLIHGDYDVDGISGTVILHQTLKDLGCRPRIFLPERSIHGYGLSAQAVEKAKKAGIKLLVSVDCGISSPETVEAAQAAGIEVIITDHHPIPGSLPGKCIIVHPQLDGDYPGGEIAGASVALKLAQSLTKASGGDVESFLELWLPLTALATVADVCPLTGENRPIVAKGLPMIPGSPLQGLRILYKGACIRNGAFGDGNVTERDVAFRMAPLLNAAGRMGDPLPAAKLLLAESEETAWRHFKVLDQLNRDRKKRQEDICRRLGNSPQLLSVHAGRCVLALVDEDCPPGLAGLAAARLADTTGRPTCVLVPGEDESGPLYRGSMRTGSDEDLLELMSGVSSITEKLGGHAGALGLTVRPERIEEFVESCRLISCQKRQRKLALDGCLKSAPTDPEDVRELDKTRPWGRGNPQPTFVWGPVTVKGTRSVGKNLEHIQMTLRDKGGSLCKGIGFNMAEDVSRNIELDQEVRAAGHFQVNSWQGNESVEFEIKDLENA